MGVKSQPSDRRAHAERQVIQRAEAFAAQQDLARAVQVLQTWCSAQRAQGFLPRQGLETLATIQLQQQHWEQAIHTLSLLEPALTSSERNRRSARLDAEAYGLAVQSHLQPAIAAYCRQLALQSDHPQANRNLAMLLGRVGDGKGAETFALKHLNLFPDSSEGWNTYGTILNQLGRHSESIQAFTKTLQIDPGNANANSNLATQYHFNASIDLAYVHGSRAVLAAPDHLGVWLDHLIHLSRVCAFDRLEAVDWWDLFERQQVDLTALLFLSTLTLAESSADQLRLLTLQQRWGRYQSDLAAASRLPAPPPLPRDPAEPLRIGFVSADFRDHSVARFIWPLFDPEGGFNNRGFSLYAYSTNPSADLWRQRFQQAATAFHDVEALSPSALGRCIQADGVHVLFDLTGFTKSSRTACFAWRPAQKQVSWLGFPGSTGLPQMDHLFLDRYLSPSDPSLITETPLVSAGSSVCFGAMADLPITPVLPEQQRGFLTFGSLNNPYKFTRSTIARWARVLAALPESRFLFVRQEFSSYYLRQHLIAEFSRHGIAPERLAFLNNREIRRHYLDCYNEIDLTLDTFPVTGGTTTIDALWMGVPVVALEGPNVHQRVCSAILHHAGHGEWIARDDEQFQEIALHLAADRHLRARLRESLREELKVSALCDTQRFVADFAAAMNSLRPS